jgi:hypothetical protein
MSVRGRRLRESRVEGSKWCCMERPARVTDGQQERWSISREEEKRALRRN